MNIRDLSTKIWGETLTQSISADEMKQCFEVHWFYNNSVPKLFSSVHEFWLPVLKLFLTTHDIFLNPRRSRF